MALFSKTKKVAGWLAIGLQDEGIYGAYVTRSSSSMPVVEKAGFYPCDRASHGDMLEKLAKELQAKRHSCSNVLTPNEYQLLSVEAPNVPPGELRAAIRWRVKDMLDFHIDDATVDVLNVPMEKNQAIRSHAMYAVAARNQMIGNRQMLFEKARVPLSVIDIPEMAQRNITALVEPDGRGIAMLSFDAGGGLLTITAGGELYLSRRIDITLSQLLQADSEQRNTYYDRITLELQRSLDHFDRQYHFISLAKMMLAPMGEAGVGLQAYLGANLYISVESLALDSVLDLSQVPELKPVEMHQQYLMVLGAALRYEQAAL